MFVFSVFFFFFQAEDGIRDLTVTGVQTCALPISLRARHLLAGGLRFGRALRAGGRSSARGCFGKRTIGGGTKIEIGRASCRERSVDLGGRRIIKKKKGKGEKVIGIGITENNNSLW